MVMRVLQQAGSSLTRRSLTLLGAVVVLGLTAAIIRATGCLAPAEAKYGVVFESDWSTGTGTSVTATAPVLRF